LTSQDQLKLGRDHQHCHLRCHGRFPGLRWLGGSPSVFFLHFFHQERTFGDNLHSFYRPDTLCLT